MRSKSKLDHLTHTHDTLQTTINIAVVVGMVVEGRAEQHHDPGIELARTQEGIDYPMVVECFSGGKMFP